MPPTKNMAKAKTKYNVPIFMVGGDNPSQPAFSRPVMLIIVMDIFMFSYYSRHINTSFKICKKD
jgi:hypothetical protein